MASGTTVRKNALRAPIDGAVDEMERQPPPAVLWETAAQEVGRLPPAVRRATVGGGGV